MELRKWFDDELAFPRCIKWDCIKSNEANNKRSSRLCRCIEYISRSIIKSWFRGKSRPCQRASIYYMWYCPYVKIICKLYRRFMAIILHYFKESSFNAPNYGSLFKWYIRLYFTSKKFTKRGRVIFPFCISSNLSLLSTFYSNSTG